MPITFACSCGKTLRVKDDLAGRWVRCPACKESAIVPEAAMQAKPAFEVVDDTDDDADPPPRARVKAEPAPFRFGDDKPASRPKSRPDQEYDGPRKASRRKRRREKEEQPQGGHFALERNVFNGGVAGGLLAMIGAVVWFVVGLMNDIIFYYPPILFLIGLFGFFRGLIGSNND